MAVAAAVALKVGGRVTATCTGVRRGDCGERVITARTKMAASAASALCHTTCAHVLSQTITRDSAQTCAR